jgi:hypothetical protein
MVIYRYLLLATVSLAYAVYYDSNWVISQFELARLVLAAQQEAAQLSSDPSGSILQVLRKRTWIDHSVCKHSSVCV